MDETARAFLQPDITPTIKITILKAIMTASLFKCKVQSTNKRRMTTKFNEIERYYHINVNTYVYTSDLLCLAVTKIAVAYMYIFILKFRTDIFVVITY